jgi:hypothetical protein
MKIKFASAFALLAVAPIAFAGGKAAYPSEKIAGFVVEKLDLNSLPSELRPKKVKGQKTLADYGYSTQKVDEKEAIVGAPGNAPELSFKVLDATSSGIQVCVSIPEQDGAAPKTQSVVLLKRKNPNDLLKSRESSREFPSCPTVGVTSYGPDYNSNMN